MTPERRRALEFGSRLLGGGLNDASITLATERIRETIDAALFNEVGEMIEQQHVTLHRTFANGMQMGYGRDERGYRMFSRPSVDARWTHFGPWSDSWVVLADRIAKLPEREDADAAGA